MAKYDFDLGTLEWEGIRFPDLETMRKYMRYERRAEAEKTATLYAFSLRGGQARESFEEHIRDLMHLTDGINHLNRLLDGEFDGMSTGVSPQVN